jgi:FAD/FMN-containing dehydrogenase
MMQWTMRGCVVGGAVLALAIGGCTGIATKASSATLPTSAFFRTEPDELKILQALSNAQDARIKACHKGQECEDAYYVRGLVALFVNRADAITTFQGLHSAMPTSRYDTAAAGWLNLLQDQALSSQQSRALMMQLKEEVLHTLRERWNTALAQQAKEAEGRLAEVRR